MYGKSEVGVSPAFREKAAMTPALVSFTNLSCASANTFESPIVPRPVLDVVETDDEIVVDAKDTSASGGVKLISTANTTKTSLSSGFNCRSTCC